MEAIQVQVKDGRKKVRTLSITGFIKPSGKVVAKVTNDKGKEYFVSHGKCTCVSRRVCYHVQAVARVTYMLPTSKQIEQEAALSSYDVVAEAAKVVANAEAELDAAMYETLATTKKVSVPPAEYDSCKQCGCRIAVGAGYCKRC